MSFFFLMSQIQCGYHKTQNFGADFESVKKMLKFSSQKRYRPKTFVESSTSKSEQLQFTFRDTFFALHFFAHI